MLELVNMLDIDFCSQVPKGVFNIVHLVIMGIQIVVPILLIIFGMIDFAKAVVGGDEDKIKAGQKTFIKRLIAAIVVFLVVTVVKLLVGLVAQVGAEGATTGVWDCVQNFVNGVD